MEIDCRKLVSLYHPNGSTVGTHVHHNHELVYCLEGKGYVEIEGKRCNLTGGNYYLTRAGTEHSERDTDNTRIIYFYFTAPEELVLQGMFSDYEGTVISCVKKLKTETETQAPYKEDMIKCLVKTILIETIRLNESKKHGIGDVIQYIDENIENDIDFKQLAAKLHYSYERFRHLFKEYTQMSPHQYLIHQRLEKAKFLLKLNPDASLTEVSYICGFSSSSHFTKAFRSKESVTPTEYCKKLKE